MLLLLLTTSLTAHALHEWRAMVGGEFNADPHGALDFGWRTEDWQFQLVTDTIDARWQPEHDRGRGWVALRAQAGAAGLMISPWAGGAPVPEAALASFYVGPEAGHVWYLPKGFYAGGDTNARYWWFQERWEDTERSVPTAQLRAEAAGIVGFWSEHAHVWVRGGAHFAPDAHPIGLDYPLYGKVVGGPLDLVARDAGAPVQPFVSVTGVARPKDWTLAPRVEARAGTGHGMDAISRARLGGMNPYVVPLSGAAWAEFWVEDYVAVRAGPSLQSGRFTVEAVVDAAWWSDPTDWRAADAETANALSGVGYGLLTRFQPNRLYIDVDGGIAPDLPRVDGIAWTAWTVVGVDWGPGGLVAPEDAD